MEVLKGGKVPSRAAFFEDAVVTCDKRDEHDSVGCGAELRIEAEDLVPRYWDAPHSRHLYFAVICPRCRHHCYVRMPEGVFEELMTEDMRQRATFDGFGDGG